MESKKLQEKFLVESVFADDGKLNIEKAEVVSVLWLQFSKPVCPIYKKIKYILKKFTNQKKTNKADKHMLVLQCNGIARCLYIGYYWI